MDTREKHFYLKKQQEIRNAEKVIFGEMFIEELINHTKHRVPNVSANNYRIFHEYFGNIEKYLLDGNLIGCYHYLKTLEEINNFVKKEEWLEFANKILNFLDGEK